VRDKEEMADVYKEENALGEARDVTMAETDITTSTVSVTEIETESGALPTNH